MYRLSKFMNSRLMWSIENVGTDVLADYMATIMREMTHDERLSLSVEWVQ